MTNGESGGTLGCSARNSNSLSDVRGHPAWWDTCDSDQLPPPQWATGWAGGFIRVGAQLPTRDGRRTGNAVVADEQSVYWAFDGEKEKDRPVHSSHGHRKHHAPYDSGGLESLPCPRVAHGRSVIPGVQDVLGTTLGGGMKYKIQVVVVADSNDADYCTAVTEVRPGNMKDIEVLKRWAAHLESVDGNWSTRYEYDEGELATDLYSGIFSQDEFDVIADYTPSGDCGVHTIESIRIQTVQEEVLF